MTTTQYYLDHFQLQHAPFDQQYDPSVIFSLPDREKILGKILADISNGKPLIKLTGSEGTGKTVMCNLLEKAVDPEQFLLISLEHPIGSYQNLLRTICLYLGTEDEDDDEEESEPNYEVLLKEHLQQLRTEGRKLVLVIDEAESLFLATLERLVRLVCNPDDSANLQILLVGRLELDENLEQLSIYCSNVDITEGYTLEAMSLDQTSKYIRYRLQEAGIPGDKYLDLFSPDAIEMIYQGAKGNISLTNSLAELGLKRACEQGMFQVYDELIQPDQTIEDNVSLAVFQGFDFLKDNKWWLLSGILLVWFILLLFLPGSGEKEKEIAKEEKLEIIEPEVEIVIPPEPEVPETVETEEAVPEEIQQIVSEIEDPGTTEPISVTETKPDQPENIVSERKEVVLTPDKKKKKFVITQPPPQQKPIAKVARNANAVFRERVKASSTWLAWAYRGGYTIQLMVLASEKAEDNLKKILIDDKFYDIKDQLYILKKRSPKTYYLFYGNYPDMDAARYARNAMPPFLKEIHPYALSIQDALKKTQER